MFAPDHVRETFHPGTEHGGNDDEERGLRYLEWTLDPDPSDTTYITDYAYILREKGEVRVVYDQHICGLFSREEWRLTPLQRDVHGYRPAFPPPTR